MRLLARAAASVLAGLLAVAVATYVAGEQVEVAVLRTTDAAGRVQQTKLWVADHEGTSWLRVARPERSWFQRLLAHPEVELERRGETRVYIAQRDDRPETRRAVDAAFRAKYGLVDAWYGLLLRSHAVPVRLLPPSGDVGSKVQ